jgi:hypothetical protein
MFVFKITTVQTIDNQKNITMKTITLSIIAFTVLALGTVNLSQAATTSKEVCTELTDVSKINKIEIHGNVELYVSDGKSDRVKVYNHYYAESALVQNKDGVLRISSYSPQKLVVWVTVSDLRNIAAYDNAQVRSFGTLSEIGLDVNLYNNAYANLNLDSYSASINVNDKAKAELSGNVSECELKYNAAATVNQSDFIAAHYTQTKTGVTIRSEENDELSAL